MADGNDFQAPKIEIEELIEAGSDGGGLLGYYAKGHHDPVEFAQAANKHSGATSAFDPRYVDFKRVFQVHYRTIPISGDDGQFRFDPATPGRGAWPATVCRCVDEFHTARYARLAAQRRHGFEEGVAAGISWALGMIEYGIGPRDAERVVLMREIGDKLREAFRNSKDHFSDTQGRN
jgi:hypothetical protein